MQKVRSMTCLDPDLTTNARTHLDTEQRTRKGAPHQDPLSQSQTEKSPKSSFVSYFPPPSSTKVSVSQPGQAPSFMEIFSSDSEFLCGCKSWAKERSNIQFKSAPHQFKIVSHSMLNVLSNSASNKIKAKGFKTTSDFRLLQSLIRFIGSE